MITIDLITGHARGSVRQTANLRSINGRVRVKSGSTQRQRRIADLAAATLGSMLTAMLPHAFACAQTNLTIVGAQPVNTEVTNTMRLEHKADLPVQSEGGYGAFTWSPASKAIAFVAWDSGKIGIVDIDTSEVKSIPSFATAPLSSTLAWSPNGELLSVNDGKDIRIIRLSDFNIIYNSAIEERDASLRFGEKSIFSSDGRYLFVKNANDKDHVILYSLSLKDHKIRSLIKSPFGEREVYAEPRGGEFQRSGSYLTYTIKMDRYDEKYHPTMPIRYLGYFGTASSCMVIKIDSGDHVDDIRHVDFPKPGVPDPTGAHEMYGCKYAQNQNYIISRRPEPSDQPIQDDKDPPRRRIFLESISLSDPERRIRFASDYESRDLSITEFMPNPVYTVVYVAANHFKRGDRSREWSLSLWDYTNGKLLDELMLSRYLDKPQYSPDGRLLAFHSLGTSIPVYQITHEVGEKQ